MQKSKIEWTNNTYNPIKKKGGGFYCFKVSPACTHCYAEGMARRVAAMHGGEFAPYANMKNYPELELNRGMLEGWAKKRDSKLNFVSSMTDIFGEFVPDQWVFEILDAMAAAPRQIFQVLTKRAERSYKLIMEWLAMHKLDKLPPNIWMGMSIEDQIRAEDRLPWLVKIPAHVRFISCEPLLSMLNLDHWLWTKIMCVLIPPPDQSAIIKRNLIHWIIAGGESGNKKTIRPTPHSYVNNLRQQANAADIPFFFKQWGEYLPVMQSFWCDAVTEESKMVEVSGDDYYKLGKDKTGAILDGKEWKQFPLFNYNITL